MGSEAEALRSRCTNNHMATAGPETRYLCPPHHATPSLRDTQQAAFPCPVLPLPCFHGFWLVTGRSWLYEALAWRQRTDNVADRREQCVWTRVRAGAPAGMPLGIYCPSWAVIFCFPGTAYYWWWQPVYTWMKPHLSLQNYGRGLCRATLYRNLSHGSPSSLLRLFCPKRFWNFITAQFICLALENFHYLPTSLFPHVEKVKP